MYSSSCISNHQLKYDVFLSFRGKDTRENFTSHLYAALCQKKIKTFIDNNLVRGDEILMSLLNAIESSKISIIIFSNGYASSRWCLDELVKILDCKKVYGQVVIPVFYHVHPLEVRNQTGNFGDLFAMLEERFKERLEKVQRWRIALKEAANLSGFDSNVIRPESVLIENIIEEISNRLDDMCPSDSKDLVGMESSIMEIESLLCIESENIYTIGICGISGVGKTALVRVVFRKLSKYFEGSYFIQNVRGELEKSNGVTRLLQELFNAIYVDKHPNIELAFEKERFGPKKVLIFDNVRCLKQIKDLVGDFEYLGLGSGIIITTRDKQVLNRCGVDNMYELKELVHYKALQLFGQYAFEQNRPVASYTKLSNRIVKYTKGIPLAIKVLGSLLCGMNKQDWERVLSRLKNITPQSPHLDILEVLKVSYDGLDDEERNIFLDIACFLNWEDRDLAIRILNASGYSSENGLSVLIEKSLVTISNNKIILHDLLQEMGREIVQQESIKDPGKRSRLWHHKDIYHVLTKNKGTEAIQAIFFDMSKLSDIQVDPHAFSKMHKLRFLKFFSSHNKEKGNYEMGFFQGIESLFTELSYLHWHGYPLKSLRPNCYLENRALLDMPWSNIEQRLWNNIQQHDEMRNVNFGHFKHRAKEQDISFPPNVESLIPEERIIDTVKGQLGSFNGRIFSFEQQTQYLIK